MPCSHSVIFNSYQIVKNYDIWKISSFYCFIRLVVSLALSLSLLPFTCDTHLVCLQWNVSQCVQIWIFNISNTDTLTQTIYRWYKYYSKWICVSFSFQYIYFFISLSFLFIFLNFAVKRCANVYWKYDNTGFAREKKPNFFLFFKMANTPLNGQNKTHCVVIKLSFQGTMLLSRLKWPCTWWQILYKRRKERFVVLATFWKNDNSSCFWYTNSFNWKSSFVLIYYKIEDGYPNFLIFLSSFDSIVH